jgi:hypothetical protein
MPKTGLGRLDPRAKDDLQNLETAGEIEGTDGGQRSLA